MNQRYPRCRPWPRRGKQIRACIPSSGLAGTWTGPDDPEIPMPASHEATSGEARLPRMVEARTGSPGSSCSL